MGSVKDVYHIYTSRVKCRTIIHIRMSFDFLFKRNQIGPTVLAKQDSDVDGLDIYPASAMLDLSPISSMYSM